MSGIAEIVAATLDRIEERAYERGRRDAAAASPVPPAAPAAPPDDATSAVIAALVMHMAGGEPAGAGESRSVQLGAVEGRFRAEFAERASGLHISVTRLE